MSSLSPGKKKKYSGAREKDATISYSILRERDGNIRRNEKPRVQLRGKRGEKEG